MSAPAMTPQLSEQVGCCCLLGGRGLAAGWCARAPFRADEIPRDLPCSQRLAEMRQPLVSVLLATLPSCAALAPAHKRATAAGTSSRRALLQTTLPALAAASLTTGIASPARATFGPASGAVISPQDHVLAAASGRDRLS